MSLSEDIVFCLKPRCPVCKKGRLFKSWSVMPVEVCDVCNARLGQNDVGDGASTFFIFILGFLLVPLAWVFETHVSPPLWVHAVLWGTVATVIVAFGLPAVKAYIILLEYRHRRKD